MKRLLLLGVLVLGSIPFTQAQTCNCGSWNTLISRQTFQNSGNNFNCYQYARAYFSQPRSNAWVPSSSQWSWISSLDQTTIANDPSFSEVSDPQQADVVLYGCDHVAVVIANNCLISKMTYDELGTHGLNLAGCGADDVRFFKYNGYSYITPHGVDLSCQTQSGGCQNTPSNASVSGTYYSAGAGSRTLYTFNNVNAGSINATLSNISNVSYQWTRTGGSASFFVSNNGRNMSVTLNSGSISFQVQALNGCGNPIGASRTFVFQVNSSG
ncbi:MAG TPA: hypothetical protein DCP28_32175, partial [Cytophagales bacterium]|nr:hypothetical protein [Cytophagales bacterium]